MTVTVLSGARVWDGETPDPERREVIIGDDGLIASEVPAGSRPTVVDATGKLVIPGLIDAHAHLCFDATSGWRRTYDSDDQHQMLLRMAGNAARMVAAGITTVRDLGAPTAIAVALRDALRAGMLPGPDLLVAGAPVTTTGGHCYFMGGEADSELELRKAVRLRARAGVDWIKVMATGGNMTKGSNVLAPQYSLPELRTLVEEAHRLGKPTAAHCHGTAGIRIALAAGVDSLEHCSFQGEGGFQLDRDLAEEIAATGTIVSPTVSAAWLRWRDARRVEGRRSVLSSLAGLGVNLVMSTDCGIPGAPHDAIAEGLVALSRFAGLTPSEALRTATSDAAQRLGLTDRGRLRPGLRADLIVVAGDPFSDLRALAAVETVFVKGRRFSGKSTCSGEA